MTNIQTIPLAQLRPSPDNVRKTVRPGSLSISELAASLIAEGLLMNFVVTANDDHYQVEDGGRRLQALQQLESEGRLPEILGSVPCLVIDKGRATEVSLTANTMREAMHPADEFAAFQQMVHEGKTISDIAERFGKSDLHVKQRLRLANVKPELLELYREGEMNLDQLTALASTSNHELQRQAWETARGDWERNPRNLRDFIARESVRSDQPLPKFVGLEAYETAGGKVRTDLFTQEVWLTDLALLDSLAMDKLEVTAQRLRDAGWSWAETRVASRGEEPYPHFNVSADQHLEQFASPEDEARQAVVTARIEEIEAIDADDVTDEEDVALSDELTRLESEAQEISRRMTDVYSPEVMAAAGVLVMVGNDGNVSLRMPLLRPGQKQGKDGSIKGTPSALALPGSASAPSASAKKPVLSDAIKQALSAHRSEVARMHLVNDTTLAHCVLLEQMLISHWPNRYGNNGLHLSFAHNTEQACKVASLHKAVTTAIAEKLGIIKTVPTKGTLAFLLKQTYAWRLELQAALVAAHFDGTTSSEDGHDGVAEIHRITDFNMAVHWSPEVDGFTGRIHASLLSQAVTEAKGKDAAAQLNGLKKDDRAATGAKLLAGTGWLPKPLRGPSYGKKLEQTNTTTEPASKPRTGAKKAAAKKAPVKKIAAKKPAKKAPKKAAAPKAKPAKKKS